MFHKISWLMFLMLYKQTFALQGIDCEAFTEKSTNYLKAKVFIISLIFSNAVFPLGEEG